jgi:hypothetical protein
MGESFKSGKVLQLKKAETRIKSALLKDKIISSIDFYSLSDGFIQAAFDYEAFIGRTTIGNRS